MLELRQPIPLYTSKGHGFAYFVTDLGLDHDLIWTVFLDDGEIWQFRNKDVRAVENYTHGRQNLHKMPSATSKEI